MKLKLLFTSFFLASTALSLLVQIVQAAPIEVVDSAGRKVILAKPAERIIALAPHIVENVYSAGAGDKLVGVVSYSDYPPQAAKIPTVGGAHAFSLEAIAALSPDLIITWSQGKIESATNAFSALDIAVYVDEPRKLEDVAVSIRNIGQLSGSAVEANSTADQYLATLTNLRNHYAEAKSVSVFYQIWNEPLQTINDSHIIGDVIKLCGGRNIFSDTPVIAPKVSLEAVINRDPDAVVASGMDIERPEWLDEWRKYPRMSAVVNNNLYFVPPDILQRHTVRILQGAQQMCDSLQRARNKIPN